jgi:hypothetical protein
MNGLCSSLALSPVDASVLLRLAECWSNDLEQWHLHPSWLFCQHNHQSYIHIHIHSYIRYFITHYYCIWFLIFSDPLLWWYPFPMQIWCVCPPSIVECHPLKQKEFNLSHSPLCCFLVDDYYFSFLPSWLSGWNCSPWVISSPGRVFIWLFLSSSYLDRCFWSLESLLPSNW